MSIAPGYETYIGLKMVRTKNFNYLTQACNQIVNSLLTIPRCSIIHLLKYSFCDRETFPNLVEPYGKCDDYDTFDGTYASSYNYSYTLIVSAARNHPDN